MKLLVALIDPHSSATFITSYNNTAAAPPHLPMELTKGFSRRFSRELNGSGRRTDLAQGFSRGLKGVSAGIPEDTKEDANLLSPSGILA